MIESVASMKPAWLCGLAGVAVVGGFRVRAIEMGDHAAVLALVDADRLVGQPAAGGELLTAVSRKGLVRPATLVLTDTRGTIRGVAHCAVRTSDGAGLIGWLHTLEDIEAAAALIAAARAQLGPVPMLYAGTGPTQPPQAGIFPLLGIAQHRCPSTTRALSSAGFTEAATRLYFHHPLTPAPAPPIEPLADLRAATDPPGFQLTLYATDGHPMASAVLHRWDDEHWHLRHLSVRADHRKRGIASHLLAQCLHTAHARGATSLIAHTHENDHISARLLEHAHFTTIDTLTIHHRRP
ncbi:GNAT family N-acetyltransferase [Streptomyces sp900105245]|uniref:GNAT family N-acetyltransferase n=1 Tax=Streptomyces sp. 900105245 TaxID=3154379 RepID=A0ABV1ULN7_9ACTN